MSEGKQKPKIRVENISCILPENNQLGGLFLGNIYGAQNPDILKEYGIRSVLTSSLQTPTYNPQQIPFHLKIKAIDQDSYSIIDDLNQCFEFIDKTRPLTNVLVHCYAGVSRSVTIVVAYLMKRYNWSMDRALNFVKQKRVVAKPNDGFMKQLKTFEQKLSIKNEINQRNQSRISYSTQNLGQKIHQRSSMPINQPNYGHYANHHIQNIQNTHRQQISANSRLNYLNQVERNHLQRNNYQYHSGNSTPLSYAYKKNQNDDFFPSRIIKNRQTHSPGPNLTPRNQIKTTKKHSQVPIPSILKRMSSGQRKQTIKNDLSRVKYDSNPSYSAQQNFYKTAPFNMNNYQKQEHTKTTSRIIRPKDLPGYKQIS